MKLLTLSLITSASLLFTACGSSSSSTGTPANNLTGEAQYEVTFKGNWSAGTFATNYPSNAHFSPLIGLTHNDSVKLYQVGQLASPGVEQVAETGQTGTIVSEIASHITNNNAQFTVYGSSGQTSGSSEIKFKFSANQAFPNFSFVSMVAPTSDWFVGIDSIKLYESGAWKTNEDVNLRVYDAGTEEGENFSLNNAATDPKENISRLTTNAANTDFNDGVHRTSGAFIGTVNIRKIN